MLQVTGDKMSKSLGNIKSVRELLEDYDPDAIRFYLLSAHYRGPLELKSDSLDKAKSAVQRIRNCVDLMDRLGATQGRGGFQTRPYSADQLSDAEKGLNDGVDDAFRKFEETMDDDFNTSGAIAAIFELVDSANKFAVGCEDLSDHGRIVVRRVRSALVDLCKVLGMQVTEEWHSMHVEDKVTVRDRAFLILVRGPLEKYPKNDLIDLIIEVAPHTMERRDWTTNALIESIVKIRQDARERKEWAMADKIRNRLAELGIRLEDTREGVICKME
jgi:cysteinyl-tRNA synthetase